MKFILGKKLDMTQVWQGENVVAVTRVKIGPCTVSQIKNEKKDGYDAIQISYDSKKAKNINKPQIGHFLKTKLFNKDSKYFPRYTREFRIKDENIKVGDIIKSDTFEVGDNIQVTSNSKGKGFQGVVKRHGFKGHPSTHGTKDQVRMPGSSGATGPAHVFKGMRMPGRMGNDQVTVKNLEVIEIDNENNIVFIKGAVPGARNGLVEISGAGELKVSSADKKEEVKAEEPKQAEKKEENIEKVVEEAKEKVEDKK